MLTRVILATLLVATPALADVLRVNLDGSVAFTSVAAATAVAADGDLILVAPGTYPETSPVVIDGKSLTLVGDQFPTGPGVIWGSITIEAGLEIRNLAQGQSVLVQTTQFEGANGGPGQDPAPGVRVEHNAGSVRLQSCHFAGGRAGSTDHRDGAPGALMLDNSAVAVVSCFASGGRGLSSSISGSPTGRGAAGVLVEDGHLAFVQSQSNGGGGGSNVPGGWPTGGDGGHGMLAQGGDVTLTRSFIFGGHGGFGLTLGGQGGHAIEVPGAASVYAAAGTFFFPGFPGESEDGPPGSFGQSIVDPFGTLTLLPVTPERTFVAKTLVRETKSGKFEFKGPPGDLVLVLLSLGGDVATLPFYEGVLMLDTPFVLPIWTVGTPGTSEILVSVPELGPGIEWLSLYAQSVSITPTQTFLNAGWEIIALDASL